MTQHTVISSRSFFSHTTKRYLLWFKLAMVVSSLLSLPMNWPGGFSLANTAWQDNNDVRALELGKLIEREMAGTQTHAYQIALTEGQYLSLMVEQKGINLVVLVLGPDGNQLMRVDREEASIGREPLLFVAETKGRYRIIVQARWKGKYVGRYEIQVLELHTATERDRALQEAFKQETEALKLLSSGKNDEAFPLFKQALEIREKILEPDHPELAHCLVNLASYYRDKGDYPQAESLCQRALALTEKRFGPEHLEVADRLSALASIYSEMRDYDKAESDLRRALAIQEKLLGSDHPGLAPTLIVLSWQLEYKGDYDTAEPIVRRALSIREKAYGLDHPDTGSAFHNMAFLHKFKGEDDKEELFSQRALVIWEKVLNLEYPVAGATLHNLGALYRDKGNYSQSRSYFRQALSATEKTKGPDHPDLATTLSALAVLCWDHGDYAEAEEHLNRAMEIDELVFGKESLAVTRHLRNFTLLYRDKGDYEKAESACQRGLVINEKMLGPENPSVGIFLVHLANLYRDQGYYEKAEPLYQRALKIDPQGVFVLNNIARYYRAHGDYAEAESFYQKVVDLQEKRTGTPLPTFGDMLDDLAVLYREQGKFAKAELTHRRALDIRKNARGAEHPYVADSLNNLAKLYTATGQIEQAIEFQSRALAVSERNLRLNLAAGSERQKLAYLAKLSGEFDRTVSMHLTAAPKAATARNLALAVILQRKGRILDAMTDSLSVLRRRANPEDQTLLDQLKEQTSHLATIVLSGPQRTTVTEHQKRVKVLEERKEQLEGQISRHSTEFRTQAQPVTVEAIQAAIPAEAALIEFALYRPFNPKYTKLDEQFGQPRYVAYVLHRQGDIQWAELGEAKTIDDAVESWRHALRDNGRQDVKRLARAVDRLVMQPIRPLLGRTSKLLLSPDGALNLIPFAALVDERNQFLLERYSISYLTSGRDLLRLQVASEGKGQPMIFANPDFGDIAVATAPQNQNSSSGSVSSQAAQPRIDSAQVFFQPLPGTAREARELKTLFPQATVLTQQQASETALKQVRAPNILHIATHGFFMQEDKAETESTRGVMSSGDAGEQTRLARWAVTAKDPLLRSGLALAGANQGKSGEDDGVLTAMEAAGLDLWGTKLVVLSACSTGLGEVRNSEGVYGLRRALVLAGAESLVMSLWQVPDNATKDLMVAYYKALQAGQGRGEALRQVQLRMLRSKTTAHPFYWASFIQSGEWANLAGKR